MGNSNNIDIKGEELYQIAKDLCNFGYRRAGTAPAHQAEDYIFDKLKEAGLEEVKKEPVHFMRWFAEKHELMVLASGTPAISEDHVITTFPSWWSSSTPPEGIEDEVVWAGYGTKSDFRENNVNGKIALIEGKLLLNFYPTHSVKLFNTIQTAQKRGAIAVICINGSPLDTISYTNYISMYDLPSLDTIPSLSLPVLCVNNYEGLYLKHLCTRYHQKLKIRFTLVSKTEPATSNTIVGTLPGKTDDIIFLGTHIDCTFTGAMDNAAANAGLIVLAKYYAQLPREKREKTMIFAGWTGHECDSIGSRSFAENHPEIVEKIATFIELDGFGSNGYYNQADGGLVPTNLDERRGIFTDNSLLYSFAADAVLKYKLLPAAYLSALALKVGDYTPFAVKGVPSLLIIGKSPLYHTELDTLDIIRPEQLERSAKAHIEIINKIHETPAEEIKKVDQKPINMESFIMRNENVEKPSINFHVVPEILTVGDFGIFIPSVISNPESILVSYEWDLGDGTVSDNLLMIHAYRKAGSYKVRVKVMDNFGNDATQERIVRVVNKFKKK
ncbi:MAG: M28 family peptidase [Promethearchaeota archaeon]